MPQFIEIEEIEEDGEEAVYDLNVPETSCFFGNEILVHNCAELPLPPGDACRLMLINLVKFVVSPFTKEARFDFERFKNVAYVAQRLMDDLVDLEIEAIDRILEKIALDPEPEHIKRVEVELWKRIKESAANGRRTGLGITALGDLFAYLGINYGSQESVELTEKVYKTLAIGSYQSSIDMAEQRGAFGVFDLQLERDSKNPFLERVLPELGNDYVKKYEQRGRRNIANLTTAPAGSTSILTATTSGCEPVLFLEAVRYKKITASDKSARVDRVDAKGDKWQAYKVFHPGVELWMNVASDKDTTHSPYHGSTVEEIDYIEKINVQAAAQKWVDHSISNTVNTPKDVTVETIEGLCWHAWKTECKGVTVYRVGSRDAVIVKANTVNEGDEQPEKIIDSHAPKRPKELPCDIHRATIQGESYLVLIGLFNGRPYEVFAGLQENVEVPKKAKTGVLIKNGKKDGVATYNLRIPVGDDDEMTIKDIVSQFSNPTHGALTRTLSLTLRHGTPVQYVVEQLRKDKHSELFSFSNVLARTFSKNYIPDGTKVTVEKTCSECGSVNLKYQQGCSTCADCGASKCA